jgi:hypothetical protein
MARVWGAVAQTEGTGQVVLSLPRASSFFVLSVNSIYNGKATHVILRWSVRAQSAVIRLYSQQCAR